jgi:hypothetical protein
MVAPLNGYNFRIYNADTKTNHRPHAFGRRLLGIILIVGAIVYATSGVSTTSLASTQALAEEAALAGSETETPTPNVSALLPPKMTYNGGNGCCLHRKFT